MVGSWSNRVGWRRARVRCVVGAGAKSQGRQGGIAVRHPSPCPLRTPGAKRFRSWVATAGWLIAFGLFAGQARADQDLLWRGLTFWDEYQNMAISGTAKRYVGNSVEEEHSFVFNISHAEGKRLPPWEILFMVPNPGEPHLDAPTIVDRAYAFDGKVHLQFNRDYISKDRPYPKLSSASLNSGAFIGTLGWGIRNLIFKDIVVGEISSNFGLTRTQVDKSTTATVLQSGEYMGMPATELRLALNTKELDGTPAPPIIIDVWVALEPTFQVLATTNAHGGPRGGLDQESIDIYTKSRIAESFKVFDNWLVCNRARYITYDGHWIVEIDKVEPLAADYVGIWDYSKLSGTRFAGDIEKATRKGSNRIVLENTNEATYIPYTAEEQSKIRRFLLAQGTPTPPQSRWPTIVFWGANAAVICVLGWYGGRWYRARSV